MAKVMIDGKIRDATPEEEAEIEARANRPRPPPLTDDQKFERLAASYGLTPDALAAQVEKRRPARSAN